MDETPSSSSSGTLWWILGGALFLALLVAIYFVSAKVHAPEPPSPTPSKPPPLASRAEVPPSVPPLEAGSSPTPGPAPEVFSPQDRAQLVRLFGGHSTGNPRAFEELGLTDSNGKPKPEALARYRRAIRNLSKDPETWEAFLQEVEAAYPGFRR